MEMRPMRDLIFVKQDQEREYGGGIIIAASKKIVESQAQLGRYGTVMFVGPDVDLDQIKPGDRVCYGEFEYPKTQDGLFILQDADVCGVID